MTLLQKWLHKQRQPLRRDSWARRLDPSQVESAYEGTK